MVKENLPPHKLKINDPNSGSFIYFLIIFAQNLENVQNEEN